MPQHELQIRKLFSPGADTGVGYLKERVAVAFSLLLTHHALSHDTPAQVALVVVSCGQGNGFHHVSAEKSPALENEIRRTIMLRTEGAGQRDVRRGEESMGGLVGAKPLRRRRGTVRAFQRGSAWVPTCMMRTGAMHYLIGLLCRAPPSALRASTKPRTMECRRNVISTHDLAYTVQDSKNSCLP